MTTTEEFLENVKEGDFEMKLIQESVSFKTHEQLDQYVRSDVKKRYPNEESMEARMKLFQKDCPDQYHLLKSFDRAFRIKFFSVSLDDCKIREQCCALYDRDGTELCPFPFSQNTRIHWGCV